KSQQKRIQEEVSSWISPRVQSNLKNLSKNGTLVPFLGAMTQNSVFTESVTLPFRIFPRERKDTAVWSAQLHKGKVCGNLDSE
ncbi:MAG: hypothetical protein ACLU86_12240, partial [Negativibacillus massiliensis]|uniref:hypothetical protein n=1 Tax=Negativibacillus massiliensis TaxID=1871035 RepID=UPI00399C1E20